MQRFFLFFLVTVFLVACTADYNAELIENESNTAQTTQTSTEENTQTSTPYDNPNPIGASAGESVFFNKELASDGYILMNDAKNNFVYLMNRYARVKHQWNLNGGNLGNDCYLLDNGQLLAMVESDNPIIKLGGYGGKIQLLDYDGTVNWSFTHSSDDYILHHDAEMLPNGNILAMTWERHSAQEAMAHGYNLNVDLFPDGLIEIDPTTDEIVWRWSAWNHLVQDIDPNKTNYGAIGENPHLIDINYNQREDGDITHANGIAYDSEKDVIYLSVNFYSEVWVIDHSTTTAEAASQKGGNYGKGGAILYRFGNPTAYGNSSGKRLFHNNHHPNLLDGVDQGNMLIFSNGAELGQSTVYELELPESFSIVAGLDNEPQVKWSFTDSELYSPKVSGAEKLPNGNVLITEGDSGLWEVTQEKEVVWKFKGDGFFWRAYHYSEDNPLITNLIP